MRILMTISRYVLLKLFCITGGGRKDQNGHCLSILTPVPSTFLQLTYRVSDTLSHQYKMHMSYYI